MESLERLIWALIGIMLIGITVAITRYVDKDLSLVEVSYVGQNKTVIMNLNQIEALQARNPEVQFEVGKLLHW